MKLSEIQRIYVELTSDKNSTKRPLIDKSLPMKIGFIIQRNLKKMEPIIDDFDKARQKLVLKYAQRDEDGNVISNGAGVPISNSFQFNRELDDLLDTEVELEFDKFAMSDLDVLSDEEKCKEYGYDKPTVGELGALELMIS